MGLLSKFFNFLQKLWSRDTIPNVHTDKLGKIITVSKNFEIQDCIGHNLNEFFSIEHEHNKIFAIYKNKSWQLTYIPFKNQYIVYFCPYIKSPPEIWQCVQIAVGWINDQGRLLFQNTLLKELTNNSTSLQECIKNFHISMIKHNNKIQTLINEIEVEVIFTKSNENLWCITVYNRETIVKLIKQINKAQKLKELGQASVCIAHDLNNIFTAITGLSEMIRYHHTEQSTHDNCILIEENILKAANLCKQMLQFAKNTNIGTKSCQPYKIISNIKMILKNLVGDYIKIHYCISESLLYIPLAEYDFERILINLVINSRDAMQNHGTIHINLRKYVVSQPITINNKMIQTGNYCILEIIDTGPGIDESAMKKIFQQEYYSTKLYGSGLGLNNVISILNHVGGVLDVSSANEHIGGKFQIYIPIITNMQHTLTQSTTTSVQHNLTCLQGKTILCIEDDTAILNIIVQKLQIHKCKVLSTTQGKEALELIRENKIDLLITDAVLAEGIDGNIVAEKMTCPIIVISGYGESINKLFPKHSIFIPKPFTGKALFDGIHQALNNI